MLGTATICLYNLFVINFLIHYDICITYLIQYFLSLRPIPNIENTLVFVTFENPKILSHPKEILCKGICILSLRNI